MNFLAKFLAKLLQPFVQQIVDAIANGIGALVEAQKDANTLKRFEISAHIAVAKKDTTELEKIYRGINQ